MYRIMYADFTLASSFQSGVLLPRRSLSGDLRLNVSSSIEAISIFNFLPSHRAGCVW